MTMSPIGEILETVGLSAEDVTVESAGGATGRSWKVSTADGQFALRLASSPESGDRQATAIAAAAAAGLPVQQVVRRSSAVLLLSWAPGVPIAHAARSEPALAFELGRLMGETQHRLHQIPPPPELARIPTSPQAAGSGFPGPDALLHGDWHVYNILVDTTGLSCILDWENAVGGHPLADVARTYSLFTIDPALESLTTDERTALRRLADGWAAGYGPEAISIPASYLAWAGRIMQDDLAPRYLDRPDALTKLQTWTEQWERRAAESTL
ncbi:phosphotransferase family protein [Pseudonocardia xinjiangensis]|uniref:phosphotransferase family protein n=1 Tax=Pseudonocardia xinjiangensis TaxID=75289 RepID=UPI003D94A250